ncbi:heliorhodopsin HeR [Patescibacteria group bacterium]|nr:heliorhodopsin HeR [Patescibacteria group bacterium]
MKPPTLPSLNQSNIFGAVLHAGQGVAILMLSRDFRLPITTTYLTYNFATRHLEPVTRTLFHLQLSWLVAAFFFLSALAHLLIATKYRPTYETNLKNGLNKARWLEYSLSASLMMVAIAMLVGIYDLGSLLMVFALIAGMNLMGLVMEITNRDRENPNWLSFKIGCLLGIVPWVVIAIYFWAANHYGSGDIPAFVYWIYGSIFLFFNCFAINMWLQYRKIGPWKNYLYGERVYILLSLIAKSLLAWQVFAGTLRP